MKSNWFDWGEDCGKDTESNWFSSAIAAGTVAAAAAKSGSSQYAVPVSGRTAELRAKFNKGSEENIKARQAQAQTLQRYESLDWHIARLPKLSAERLSDLDKGLWELLGKDPVALQEMHMAARDPLKDVQPGVVAIDFGTSSTVVALDTHSTTVIQETMDVSCSILTFLQISTELRR
jgi:hypothetical protein